jgi:hypothetical protein
LHFRASKPSPRPRPERSSAWLGACNRGRGTARRFPHLRVTYPLELCFDGPHRLLFTRVRINTSREITAA